MPDSHRFRNGHQKCACSALEQVLMARVGAGLATGRGMPPHSWPRPKVQDGNDLITRSQFTEEKSMIPNQNRHPDREDALFTMNKTHPFGLAAFRGIVLAISFIVQCC